MTAFLLLLYSCCTRPAKWKYLLLGLVVFGLFSSWDLSLGFLSAIVIFELFRYLLSGKISTCRRNCWIIISASVVLSSILIPFNRTYDLIMSPLIVILLPSLLFTFIFGGKYKKPASSAAFPQPFFCRACCSCSGTSASKRRVMSPITAISET